MAGTAAELGGGQVEVRPASRVCAGLAALSGFIAVIAAARAAHGIADPTVKDFVRTASGFQMNHALAAFAGLFIAAQGGRWAGWAAALFLAGSALFSGSLYAEALGAPRAVLMLVPAGGFLALVGWLVLVWACFTLKKPA